MKKADKQNLISHSLTRRRILFRVLALAFSALAVVAVGFGLKSQLFINDDNHGHSGSAFRVTYETLTMKDGTILAATFAIPVHSHAKRFPVLLEYLPYRKDDSFLLRDNPYISYFASSGFAVARVDLRGSGTSDGPAVPSEYSEVELDDGDEIIRQLAEKPWSNGNIGMFGKSWSAINSLLMAARNPPALKAIVAVDGTDDTYFLDNKYPDRTYHIDDYIIEMDTENAIPQPPNYAINQEYFDSRFDMSPEHPPWTAVYAQQQINNNFYRDSSVCHQFQNIKIPVYVIGGMHDLYGEFAIRVYEGVRNSSSKVKVVLGPWDHNWPEDGSIGPHYDGKGDASRWFGQWLRGEDNGFMQEPDVTVFMQGAYRPDSQLETIPGQFRYEAWPIPEDRMRWTQLFPTAQMTLAQEPHASQSEWLGITHRASVGTELPWWWGQLVDDQAPLDNLTDTNLSFDSPLLTCKHELLGFVNVSLRVRASAQNARWVVRLEDVWPDGSVTHITGIILNGCYRNGPDSPSWMVPGEEFVITGQMHFITYTFKPGHRMRFSVNTNALMLGWPTPYQMVSEVLINTPDSFVTLPLVNPVPSPIVPPYTQIPYVPPKLHDGGDIAARGFAYDRWFYDIHPTTSGQQRTFKWTAGAYWNGFNNRLLAAYNRELFLANDDDPAHVHWEGHGLYLIVLGITPDTPSDPVGIPGGVYLHDAILALEQNFAPGTPSPVSDDIPNVDLNRYRWLVLTADATVNSTETEFQVTVVRELRENEILRRRSTFYNAYPRQFQ